MTQLDRDAAGAGDVGSPACPTVTDATLLIYYTLDESSGTILHDCSGNGNDAELTLCWDANLERGAHRRRAHSLFPPPPKPAPR